MAGPQIPHFHNDSGAAEIGVGAREFKCIGALPPFDHPHIYIDMGADPLAICSYCGTVYRHRDDLTVDQTDPPGHLLPDHAMA